MADRKRKEKLGDDVMVHISEGMTPTWAYSKLEDRKHKESFGCLCL